MARLYLSRQLDLNLSSHPPLLPLPPPFTSPSQLPTGKYVAGGPAPAGPRAAIYKKKIPELAPLIDCMRAIGAERGGKTPAQVALNWTLCKGALPIPGAKSAAQVKEIAGAAGWRLSEGEVLELERQAAKIETPLGAPFENW